MNKYWLKFNALRKAMKGLFYSLRRLPASIGIAVVHVLSEGASEMFNAKLVLLSPSIKVPGKLVSVSITVSDLTPGEALIRAERYKDERDDQEQRKSLESRIAAIFQMEAAEVRFLSEDLGTYSIYNALFDRLPEELREEARSLVYQYKQVITEQLRHLDAVLAEAGLIRSSEESDSSLISILKQMRKSPLGGRDFRGLDFLDDEFLDREF